MPRKPTPHRTPQVLATHSRASTVLPDFLRLKFGVHNGRAYLPVEVTEAMIGHRLGEFAPTRVVGWGWGWVVMGPQQVMRH